MDLIVTHTNADFDALGSLIAAKKIYPNSRLLLPGSPERAVREFLSLFKDVIKVENEKECVLTDVDRIIVVDTRHKSRIGIASNLVDMKGVKTVIYDHHPRTKYDLKASKDIYGELGATVTILLDIIKRRGIKLSPIEATILLLAIYEETGSLTFRTTTRKDVDAVSYLLSSGAKLNMVSSYLNSELTEEELAFLVRLINSTHIYDINGVKVAICICHEDSYVGELGTIVNKLIDVENIKVIFVLLHVNSKIHLIARSHIPDVNVNKILKNFGGAGHEAAASAKIMGEEPDRVRSRLIKLLKSSVKVRITAKDIMSKPVTLDMDMKIRDARKFLLKNKIGGAVVLSEDKKLLGVINMKNINKAIRKRYGHARVKGYIFTKIDLLKPNTPLYVVQELLSSKDTGIIPVLDRKRLIGMVTRNDVLKILHHGLIVNKKIKKKAGAMLNLSGKMRSVLPKKLMKLLKHIGDMAEERHCAAFVVGGFVRDLILGVKNFDVDIVIEGDAVDFSRQFAGGEGGTLVIHKKFGTATIVMPWGLVNKGRFKVDIATARREKYKHPAALPDVEFSSLRDDLYRRDFTINAMAIALNRNNFGQVIDFFDGQRHLEERRVSVLHKGSFIDDPTRIFRAVRFEQRYCLRIDRPTEQLIKTAIKKDMFGRTEKQRIREELILILKEEDPFRAIMRMHQLDELRFVHPDIELNRDLKKLFKEIGETCEWYKTTPLKKRALDNWIIYLMVLFDNLTLRNVESICEKFTFKRGDKKRIISFKEEGAKLLKFLSGNRNIAPSEVYRRLRGLSYEVIILLMAKLKTLRGKRAISDFLLKSDKVRIRSTGDDLEKMGYLPGPDLGKVLNGMLHAKIDGQIKTKKDEISYARRMLK